MNRLVALLLALLLASCAPRRPAEASEWNHLFERQSGFGWSGGDAATSVPLPGNRTLWLFGDSYLSGVARGRREQLQYRFGNTIAIQANAAGGAALAPDQMRFDWSASPSQGWLPIDAALLRDPAAPPSAAHALADGLTVLSWPLHGIVVGNDLVLFNIPVTSFRCATCGLFPLKIHGSVITLIPGVDRPYEQWGFRPGVGWDEARAPHPRFVPHSRAGEALDDPSGLVWGTFVLQDPEDPGAIYIYGHRASKTVHSLLVARVLGVEQARDLLDFDSWMFWDGRGWTMDPERAAALLDHSEMEASVVPVPESEGGGFALVQSGDIRAGEIRVAMARNPWGPFVDRYRLSLADCPVMTGYDARIPRLTYAAKAHPEFSDDDELLVSVVTMPLEGNELPSAIWDPGQYVPRFIRLPWSEVTSYAHSSAERCDRPVRAAASAGAP